MKIFLTEGEVHKRLDNGSYRVKAKILNPELQMYINGIIVFAPSEEHDDWAVYTPKAYKARILEFANSSILWQEIKSVCIDAVKLYNSDSDTNQNNNSLDYLNLNDEDYNKQLKKQLDDAIDEIPF